MDKIELQSLRQELADCDCLEAQRRELLYSRRWFVRTLAGAARRGGLRPRGRGIGKRERMQCEWTKQLLH